MEKDPQYVSDHYRLCSDHFDEEFVLQVKKLLPDALPTIFDNSDVSSKTCF